MKTDLKGGVHTVGVTHTRHPAGGTHADATSESPQPPETQPHEPEAVDVKALRRVQGLVDVDGPKVGVGARQIAHNLGAIGEAPPRSKTGAAVSGMLLALTLVFTSVTPAHADDTLTLAPTTASRVLPDTTGPPSFVQAGGGSLSMGTSVFSVRLGALQTVEQPKPQRPMDPVMHKAVADALQRFDAALVHAVRMDAEGMAMGGPRDPGAPLTALETNAFRKAVSDLVREMPVGALSPRLADSLKDLLHQHGLPSAGVENRQLKELGAAGEQLVRAMVDELRTERPAVFWGLAAGVAGAVGYASYSQGSSALGAVGLKPELKTSFFDDQLVARVALEWAAKFTDPKVTARLEQRGSVELGGVPYATTVGVGLVGGGHTFKQMELSGFELSGSLRGTTAHGGMVELSSAVVFQASGQVGQATLSGSYVEGRWRATVGASYFAADDRAVGQLSFGYRPSKNVDWALVGTSDGKNTTVGVGLTIGF